MDDQIFHLRGRPFLLKKARVIRASWACSNNAELSNWAIDRLKRFPLQQIQNPY